MEGTSSAELIFEGLHQQLYETKSLSAARVLESFDVVGDVMTQGDLDTVLRFCGLFLTQQELGCIMRACAREGAGDEGKIGGGMIYAEDVKAWLVPPMNARRSRIVDKAFAAAGPSADGTVSSEALLAKMNVAAHPIVRCGGPDGAAAQIEEFFRGKFPEGAGISGEQFSKAFEEMSAAIGVDEIFVDTVRKMFDIDEADSTDDDAIRPLVLCLQEKIRQKVHRVDKQPGSLLIAKLKHYALDIRPEPATMITLDQFWACMQYFGVVQDSTVHGWVSPQDKNVAAALRALFSTQGGGDGSIDINGFVTYVYPGFAVGEG